MVTTAPEGIRIWAAAIRCDLNSPRSAVPRARLRYCVPPGVYFARLGAPIGHGPASAPLLHDEADMAKSGTKGFQATAVVVGPLAAVEAPCTN